MSMHEWIKTGLSITNTVIVIVGAAIAYNEFVDKSDTNETDRIEETYRRVEVISEQGSGFLASHLVDEDPMPNGLQPGGLTDYQRKVDEALAAYYSIALCVESEKCDVEVVERLICPFLLTDARVINRTFVREVKEGGVFIDRMRFWSFYEQVESCLENIDALRIDHAAFLKRFQDKIDLLNDADRSMFEGLRRRGLIPKQTQDQSESEPEANSTPPSP